MKKRLIIFTTSIICIISFFACNKKVSNPPNPNEGELITTIQIIFEDSSSVQPNVTAVYRDLDGDGGFAPSTWDTIKLKSNTVYNAHILLLDESNFPVDTISNEVLEENKDHLFCYTVTNTNTTIQRTDTDGTYEVGLETKWTTGVTSTGNVQITLKHQPDIKDGTCEPGATDLDIGFVIKINN